MLKSTDDLPICGLQIKSDAPYPMLSLRLKIVNAGGGLISNFCLKKYKMRSSIRLIHWRRCVGNQREKRRPLATSQMNQECF